MWSTDQPPFSPVKRLGFRKERKESDVKKQIVAVTLLSMWISAASLAAEMGLVWETEIVQSGKAGQKDTTDKTKTYHSGDAMRIESTDGITILNMKTGNLYQLDPQKKTYTERALNKMFDDSSQEGNSAEKMMSGMADLVKVEKTDETGTISGFKCIKYTLTIMGMVSEHWLTTDVASFKTLNAKAKENMKEMAKTPMLQSILGVASNEKLDGFPVKTISQIGSVKTTTTVKKVDNWKIDATKFEIPSDYALVKSTF
jgi:hypothetical protein